MGDHITEAEYKSTVTAQAYRLAAAAEAALDDGRYEQYHGAVTEMASERTAHNHWFARSYHDVIDYGAIVKFAMDGQRYSSDRDQLVRVSDHDTPDRIVKHLAYELFLDHVIETALEDRERLAKLRQEP
jgi:hypothetical protein